MERRPGVPTMHGKSAQKSLMSKLGTNAHEEHDLALLPIGDLLRNASEVDSEHRRIPLIDTFRRDYGRILASPSESSDFSRHRLDTNCLA